MEKKETTFIKLNKDNTLRQILDVVGEQIRKCYTLANEHGYFHKRLPYR